MTIFVKMAIFVEMDFFVKKAVFCWNGDFCQIGRFCKIGRFCLNYKFSAWGVTVGEKKNNVPLPRAPEQKDLRGKSDSKTIAAEHGVETGL